MTTSIFLEGYFIYYPVSIRYGSLNDHLNPFWIIFIRMTVITLKDKNTFTPGSRTCDFTQTISAVMFFTMMPVFEGYKVPVWWCVGSVFARLLLAGVCSSAADSGTAAPACGPGQRLPEETWGFTVSPHFLWKTDLFNFDCRV